ncbi:MAG TPA: GNAT family N-acetyltransferase [Xanthobacteraceae bacterium]|nr:GNAT family N-acetyltransferase [Xanthobacteraceae bacterium]
MTNSADTNRIGRLDALSDGSLAGLWLYHAFAPAEEPWRRLAAHGLLTPYQQYGFLHAWWQELGRPRGIAPLIVVGHAADGTPLFLWALGTRRHGMVQVAEAMGGKHANFCFGPWAPAMLAAGGAGLTQALALLRAAAPEIDALVLPCQAAMWEGRVNPFATRPGVPSPSDAYAVRLEPDPDAYRQRVLSHDARKQMRAKTRKLAALPGFSTFRAGTSDEAQALITVFLRQKAAYFDATGIANPFAEPGAPEFLRRLGAPGGGLGVYGLEVAGETIAVLGGLGDGRRFSAMFNSYAPEPHGRLSPGAVLTDQAIADLCRRGYESFDLGTGEARYKDQFCDQTIALVDVTIGFSLPGKLHIAWHDAATRLKRYVKRSPLLAGAAKKARRLLRV